MTLSLLAMFGAAISWSKVSVRFDGSGNSGSVKVVFSMVAILLLVHGLKRKVMSMLLTVSALYVSFRCLSGVSVPIAVAITSSFSKTAITRSRFSQGTVII